MNRTPTLLAECEELLAKLEEGNARLRRGRVAREAREAALRREGEPVTVGPDL